MLASLISPLEIALESPPTQAAIEQRRVVVAELQVQYRPRLMRWLISAVLLGLVWSYPLFAGASPIPPGLAACVVAGGYCFLAWQANAVLSLYHALRLEASYLEEIAPEHCADMRALCASYPEAELYRMRVLTQGRRFINADFELLNSLPEQAGEAAYDCACKALYSLKS